MKKHIAILITILCTALTAPAQEHLRERVYISTDKDVYVAGDALWYSALCVDVNEGRLSDFSSIAYLELHSSEGMVQTSKVALEHGRGAGRIVLDSSLPTGNYKLIAYTAQSFNESGFDYSQYAKVVSVFNTLSNARVEGGVEIVEDAAYAKAATSNPVPKGDLSVQVPQVAPGSRYAPVRISNSGNAPVTVSLSVFHEDVILSPEGGTDIVSFTRGVRNQAPASGYTNTRIAEYEGEIIMARAAGAGNVAEDVEGMFAIISAPGYNQNVYSSILSSDGTTRFYTSNIYGDVELFMEIENLPDDRIVHLELESPFANAPAGDIPVLGMSPSIAGALEDRSAGMQISRVFDADTLYDFLPRREHEFLAPDFKRYILDDYTRFPVMEELFIEYVQELQARKINGKDQIRVLMSDTYDRRYFSDGNSLMLLDGVPVLDHSRILSYDPILVHHIDIYPYTYQFGPRVFSGIVNFATYKGNLASMEFPDNVRVIDFQGVSVPMAFTCSGVGDDYPDYRQTIYWHPSITVDPGETVEVGCKLPAYKGRFAVVAEGVTEELDPVSCSSYFEIR